MIHKIKAGIDKYRLIKPGSRILAACSGGPDSLVLVHVLNRLKTEYGCSLAVAHVNHLLRPEAAAEAEFVVAFATGLGLKCWNAAIDVTAYQQANKISSLEEAARLVRYQYLRSTAAAWGGALIATGHHRDDQVETVLLNFLRGAGNSGLRGMQPLNQDVIRPLLGVSRQEIEEYCQQYELEPRQDSSNFTTDYRRNLIRLELLPELEKKYNPAIRQALWRLAALAGDEHEYIRGEAAKLWGTVVISGGENIVIDSQALADIPVALQRELIRQVIEKKRGELTGISFAHVEKILIMAISGTVGSVLTLPKRLIARKTYTSLVLEDGTADTVRPALFQAAEPVELSVPGHIKLGRYIITAEIIANSPQKTGRSLAAFDLAKLALPIVVRSRVPGDKFRPLGLGGRKKLKEFFIDNKVPEAVRDQVPIIADQQEIIWVAGYRQSEHGKIEATTKKILQLSITKQEEF